MKHAWLIIAAFVTAMAVGTTVVHSGDDTTITLDQVPKPVRETIVRLTKGAVIDEIEREEDKGVVHYEVDYTRDGEEWEADIAPDGSVINHGRD